MSYQIKSNIILLAATFILFLSSCQPEKKIGYDIIGQVLDPITNAPVEGAKVDLYTSDVSYNIMSSEARLIASETSDAEGKVRWQFPIEKAASFRIDVSKDNYIPQSYYYETKYMGTTFDRPHKYYLPSKSTLIINVKNTNPIDTTDYISFFYTGTNYNCENCCNNFQFVEKGMNVDKSYYCYLAGGSVAKLFITVKKQNIPKFFGDSVYVPPFDTAYININY